MNKLTNFLKPNIIKIIVMFFLSAITMALFLSGINPDVGMVGEGRIFFTQILTSVLFWPVFLISNSLNDLYLLFINIFYLYILSCVISFMLFSIKNWLEKFK
ncbi:MAG: hypothetical protein Q7S66_03855 [bacterium]|nr:hypothetical protein [bacterium]